MPGEGRELCDRAACKATLAARRSRFRGVCWRGRLASQRSVGGVHMTDELGGFAPPPFNADSALLQIKRSLRDMKLAERGKGFDLRGKPVLELAVEGEQIQVRVARKLALTPDWDRLVVGSAAGQRKFIDDVKRRLERWERED